MYDTNFLPPGAGLGGHWGANLHQDAGIKDITKDLKTLGFRKRPHEHSCRQKAYELSRTGNFMSAYNSNNQVTFMSSFNNSYDKHRLNLQKSYE